MIFYLGAPELVWLERLTVPLFVSRSRSMRMAHKFPRARVPWALDSGGYCEITRHGRWRTCAADFARDVEFFQREIGGLEWSAPQDFMCEDEALAHSGLSVAQHQQLTIDNILELRSLSWRVPWIPVLQGRTLDDYFRHIDDYARHGIDLSREPLVGIGSICRRKQTHEAAQILRAIGARGGLTGRMHAFGLAALALREACDVLASSDSMAWSATGRRHGPPAARNEASYALEWRQRLLGSLPPRCSQIHPALGENHAEFLRRASSASRPQGKPGSIWARELYHLVADAERVIHQNGLLEQEETLGLPRGALFWFEEVFDSMPDTWRATLSETTRQRLSRLTSDEWQRIGSEHAQWMVQNALAYTDPGPTIAPDPYAAYAASGAAAAWAVER